MKKRLASFWRQLHQKSSRFFDRKTVRVSFIGFLLFVISATVVLHIQAEQAVAEHNAKNKSSIATLRHKLSQVSKAAKSTEHETTKLHEALGELKNFITAEPPHTLKTIWLGELVSGQYYRAKQASLARDYNAAKVAIQHVYAFSVYQQKVAEVLSGSNLSLRIKDEATANDVAAAWAQAAKNIRGLQASAELTEIIKRIAQGAEDVEAYAKTVAEFYHKLDGEALKQAEPEFARRLQAIRTEAEALDQYAAGLDANLANALGAASLHF